MKVLVQLVALLCVTSALASESYRCVVMNAVVKNPGSSFLADATEQDPNLKSMFFFVDRPSGKITGSALFDNAADEVEIVRDVRGTVDDFVVTSKKKGELRVLRIAVHDGKRTFIFFAEPLGILLSGECNVVYKVKN